MHIFIYYEERLMSLRLGQVKMDPVVRSGYSYFYTMKYSLT